MAAPLLNLQERFQFLADGLQQDGTALGERAVDGDGDRSFHVRREVNPWLALCDALEAVGPAVNAYIAAEGRL